MEAVASSTGEPFAVECSAVGKLFGAKVILADLELKVPHGEKVALLGISGSGKTTLLRLIAGLETPSSGTIYFGGRPTLNVGHRERNVGMVFQTPAVYPHMTVRQNLAFPLAVRKRPKSEVAARVVEIGDLLAITGIMDQRGSSLSGGETQRVAIGKALANPPAILLLDEPFSNLDQSLRWRLLDELKTLHTQLRLTTILVTHNAAEAFYFADRVGVLHRGRIAQLSKPEQLVMCPESLEIAQLTFSPSPNILTGDLERVEEFEGRVACEREGLVLTVSGDNGADWPPRVYVLWRPQDGRCVEVGRPFEGVTSPALVIKGRITDVAHFEEQLLVSMDCGGVILKGRAAGEAPQLRRPGELHIDPKRISFFDPKDNQRLPLTVRAS